MAQKDALNPKSPSIQVITVNYNGYADTIECLDSLRAQVGVNCRPLVIDNASHDGSVAHIKAAHPDVEIIETKSNLGFCGGNNVGIRHALEAGYDYLFLVNNDTELEPDCLQNLLRCAESHPDAAVIAPAMYGFYDRTEPWFIGSSLDMHRGIATAFHGENAKLPDAQTPFEIPWSTGCAMLIPAAKMREIGGFDERYFCYYEDVDWSLRARQLGYTCVLCPSAVLYHKEGRTANKNLPKKEYYYARNVLLCFSKNTNGKSRYRILYRLTKVSLHMAAKTMRDPEVSNPARLTRARLVGILDFYRKRFGPCRYVWE